MADTTGTAPRARDSFRGTAVLAYILFLIGWPSLHLSTIAAVILSYVQRGDARGTIWESHFNNIIQVFWVCALSLLVVIPLCFIGIGIPLLILLLVWFLYRTIKGLIRALDERPYT